MKGRKVVSDHHLPASPHRIVALGAILWLYADRYQWPGWVVGGLGALLILLFIGAVGVAWNDEEREPQWKE